LPQGGKRSLSLSSLAVLLFYLLPSNKEEVARGRRRPTHAIQSGRKREREREAHVCVAVEAHVVQYITHGEFTSPFRSNGISCWAPLSSASSSPRSGCLRVGGEMKKRNNVAAARTPTKCDMQMHLKDFLFLSTLDITFSS